MKLVINAVRTGKRASSADHEPDGRSVRIEDALVVYQIDRGEGKFIQIVDQWP
jgi:hypothetical protein